MIAMFWHWFAGGAFHPEFANPKKNTSPAPPRCRLFVGFMKLKSSKNHPFGGAASKSLDTSGRLTWIPQSLAWATWGCCGWVDDLEILWILITLLVGVLQTCILKRKGSFWQVIISIFGIQSVLSFYMTRSHKNHGSQFAFNIQGCQVSGVRRSSERC